MDSLLAIFVFIFIKCAIQLNAKVQYKMKNITHTYDIKKRNKRWRATLQVKEKNNSKRGKDTQEGHMEP